MSLTRVRVGVAGEYGRRRNGRQGQLLATSGPGRKLPLVIPLLLFAMKVEPAPSPADPAAVYLEHLERITQIANSLCKRNGVFGADAEDFLSEVRLRLLEDDYGIIRKHRGASSIITFLTVVIGNMFRDYRIKMWG